MIHECAIIYNIYGTNVIMRDIFNKTLVYGVNLKLVIEQLIGRGNHVLVPRSGDSILMTVVVTVRIFRCLKGSQAFLCYAPPLLLRLFAPGALL